MKKIIAAKVRLLCGKKVNDDMYNARLMSFQRHGKLSERLQEFIKMGD